MVTYAVFGLGLMGKVIVADLMEHDPECVVRCFDLSEDRITALEEEFKEFSDRIQLDQLQLTEDTRLTNELRGVDVAFGSIDYKYNLLLTKECIQHGTHFLDLGGNPDVVAKQRQLDEAAKQAGVTIIPDCGLAPGMVNVIAAGVMDQYDELEECHIRVGGLPKEPQGILGYQQLFSIRGLTNEYIEPAIIIRDGVLTRVPSLTEIEDLAFDAPFDNLEAFHTSGGTSSLPKLYLGKIGDLTYKTIRYRGHVKYFQFLVEYNLFDEEPIENCQTSPREIIESHLSEHLPSSGRDVVLIRITVSGKKGSGRQVEVWENITYQRKYSAMAQTTSFPISIIGQFIAHSKISQKGVLVGERAVPFDLFINELQQRGIIFKQHKFSH